MKFLRAALTIILISIATTSYAQISPVANTPTTYYVSPAYTNATTTFSSVAGLAFTVSPNGTYHATCHITWQGSLGTATPKYQFTGPNGSTLTMFTSLFSPFNFTSFQTSNASTYSTAIANTSALGATGTNFTDIIEFVLVNGTNTGTVQLQAASNGSGTLTIQVGSNCIVQ